MTNPSDIPTAGDYSMRVRAYSAAHLNFDQHFTANWPDATAMFVSEYTGGQDGRAYPVTIHGEIRGHCESLADAELRRLGTAISNVFPIFALAANAAIADPIALASYGLDLSKSQPATFYQTPSANRWFPPGARRFDLDATAALAISIGTRPCVEILMRAVESYRRALGHWFPEQRLLAGEYLFIAAETLSRFLIESRAAERNLTSSNLARLNACTVEKLRNRFLLDDVFGGDHTAFDALQKASNGFEHGYMSVSEVRGLMELSLENSMRLVRRALISASAVEPAMAARLLVTGFDEPRGLVPAIQFAKGSIRAVDPANPPQIDMGAIDMDWSDVSIAARVEKNDSVSLSLTTTIRAASIPPGVEVDIESQGIRAANVAPQVTE